MKKKLWKPNKAQLIEWVKAGKVNGITMEELDPQRKNPGKSWPFGTIVAEYKRTGSVEKDYIHNTLLDLALEFDVRLYMEYRWCERRWRFDWCFESVKLAIEYNGIMSDKSRHTTIKGYSGDMEKINRAQADGFKVLQYTPLNYRDVWEQVKIFFGN